MTSSTTKRVTYAAAVGGNVSAELGRRGMSRNALAQALDRDPSWVSRRLNGTRPLNVAEIEQIALVLDIDPNVITTVARA